MIKRNLFFLAMLMVVPVQVFAWPWSTDMMNQPSIKPQEGPPAVFPQRSVPVSGIPTKVKDRQAAEKLKNPFPATAESLKTGKTLFKIICAACHGLTGKADSPVSPKIGAIDLTSDYVQETLTEGWIWGTITFGSAIMPAYGVPTREVGGSNDLSPEERWHVVNYVKKQLVKDAAASGTASIN
ncbi:MAG: cytochrome c [Gammaproteobacteria bacterium]|nr:cytochrome c [Gammaproteobacteria bacterium]MDH5729843.1 cytochrome c [Gammaproteobacteria bacterium]